MKQILIARLAAGETIHDYKEGGNSMTPRIKSREPVNLAPPDHAKLEVGDMVFCKVSGNFYTHLISAVKPGQFQISNNHGHVNGWTTWDKVYGIVTHVSGCEVGGALAKVKVATK
jgi:hypothetical protein